MTMELMVVACAALFAGFVDAIVGGGGLILVPALFTAFPTAHPATLFGTNKSASVWGTSFSAWRYAHQVRINWTSLLPALLVAFMGALFGAWLATVASPLYLRKALPFVLLGVLAYTLAKKNLGTQHAPHLSPRAEQWVAGSIGLTIGLYDGFFGPGTGSFFVFLLVRWLGYDFLHASASAKLLNVATNLASIALFAAKGHVWWHLTLVLAISNVLGSWLGTHMTLKHGAGFVRGMFLVVVSALICKTAWDAFLA